jgi:hypothetical protein
MSSLDDQMKAAENELLAGWKSGPRLFLFILCIVVLQ